MRKTSIIISCIALVAIAFSAGCGGSVPISVSSSVPAPYESAPTGTVVTAEYTELAPRIDGVASELDEAWTNAQSTIVKVSDSANTYEVTLKAAFDDENFFLLATWKDESMDIGGKPWEVREGGTFKSGTSLPKQDMFALGFEASPIKEFTKQGCSVLCHDNSYMATNDKGEFIDIWTWMSAESGQLGTANDYVVGPLANSVDPKGETFETTSAYSYFPGSLYINKRNARSPEFMQRLTIPYSLMTIGDLSKMVEVPADTTGLPAGLMVPYYIKNPGTGDVACQAKYDDQAKAWTVEFKRKLVTANPTQVQFAHKLEDGGFYLFGLSLFDNQKGVSHVYTTEPVSLEFSGK